MKIGFLFNHDQLHQVAHSLPVALALAAAGTGAEIVLAVTNARLRGEIERYAGAAIRRGELTLVELGLARSGSRALAALVETVLPARKLLVYRDNLDFFRSLDVLVVAEKTSLILKRRYGLDRLKIIHTRHGAGDRAIGFDRASAAFDHVLVSGPKVQERLMADAGVEPARISVVGYPKFDLADPHPRRDVADRDGRPIVLYNPHVSPHLSSWYGIGRQVLDWFVEQDDYRLIFAPHVMLFERPFVVTVDRLRIDRAGGIPKRWLRAPHIHIDLGSRASTTMAYTEQADIYLGDVSSQIYEFLRRPRPCIFLDADATAWQGDPNYLHWQAGQVVRDVDGMAAALAAATAEPQAFRDRQQLLFEDSIALTDTPSSQRAAAAVARVAGLRASWGQGAEATHSGHA